VLCKSRSLQVTVLNGALTIACRGRLDEAIERVPAPSSSPSGASDGGPPQSPKHDAGRGHTGRGGTTDPSSADGQLGSGSDSAILPTDATLGAEQDAEPESDLHPIAECAGAADTIILDGDPGDPVHPRKHIFLQDGQKGLWNGISTRKIHRHRCELWGEPRHRPDNHLASPTRVCGSRPISGL